MGGARAPTRVRATPSPRALIRRRASAEARRTRGRTRGTNSKTLTRTADAHKRSSLPTGPRRDPSRRGARECARVGESLLVSDQGPRTTRPSAFRADERTCYMPAALYGDRAGARSDDVSWHAGASSPAYWRAICPGPSPAAQTEGKDREIAALPHDSVSLHARSTYAGALSLHSRVPIARDEARCLSPTDDSIAMPSRCQ
mmetsp:Transcript_15818/g.40769  ORF Transcript_15818/g.40769 Transcript_15818/m.40769 type:complete len:201 (+) Transcript_15818:2039-2641(+)